MGEMLGTLTAPSPLAVLIVAMAGGPLTALVGWCRPRLAARAAIVMAVLALLAAIGSWNVGGGTESLPWAPSWGLRFDLAFDGVSAIYALLATGIGSVVLLYSSAYLPRHLRHHSRDPSDATNFYAMILLFMGAMVGLVIADDLFLLFIFWDLTAVMSYFLIGFDRDEPLARPAALMALLVTGGTAILMLAGIVILWLEYGTSSVSVLAEMQTGGTAFSVAVAMIVIAALAKSAQMPLHFWLPRAMVAPTPVSSYLHSAAMVAAGVFLLERLYPLIHRTQWLPEALIVIGITSIAIGGILALSRDDMKRVLAYSTIGQYGYVVTLIGLGGTYGAVGAAIYVLAHAAAKCALFLTAGAVSEATGKKTLSEAGGALRDMPVVAVASGIAAGAIAALPLTLGYWKDELFFAAMHQRGFLFTALAVLAAASTFAYIGRFWGLLRFGSSLPHVLPLPWPMPFAIGLLAFVCLTGGIWVGPANALANAGGSATLKEQVSIALAYHLDMRPENLMALSAYTLGAAMLGTMKFWARMSLRLAAVATQIGPDRVYREALEAVNRLSDRLHDYEIHDLRGRVARVLMPVGVFVLLGLIFTSNENAYLIGSLVWDEAPIILVLVAAGSAAVSITQIRGHLAAVILLSAVGFPLAAVYAFLGAPDVALVAVLMETMLSLLFVGFLAAMRERPTIEGFQAGPAESQRWRDRLIGLVAGATALVVVWGILSKPSPIETAAQEQIALTPSAHARDVVTAILSDFRGLDTMGEITVIGITMIGLLTLLQRPTHRRIRE